LEKDLELLRPYKLDAVFAPEAEEMYPQGFETFLDPGRVAAPLEGAARPGHFRGVATVVLKLFHIVEPDVAYFGQKDFQQVLVIRRLVEDLNLSVRLVICPIVREPDGLALSSRNALLNPEERQAALVLHRSLRRAEELAHAGQSEAGVILEQMRQVFAAEPRAELDYAALVDPASLEPVERVTSGCVALVAARVGPARLIDNLILGPPGAPPEMLLQLALRGRVVADSRARVPGFETAALRRKVEACRDCAALASMRLPPREFLAMYLARDYPDLNAVRIAVIGRDAPLHSENFLYREPEKPHRFTAGLFALLGVENFAEFKSKFVLTDAVRCHAMGPRVPEKALAHCARHLREELKLFPNLEKIVVLGEDAYWQFQTQVLGLTSAAIRPYGELLKNQGWARETHQLALLGDRRVQVIYCHHPTLGYQRSPSLAALLE
jgi:pantoate--beta-alanine ligase